MLQSQQSWLPVLHEPVKFKDFLSAGTYQQKLIAHCEEDNKQLINSFTQQSSDQVILIGPEGDFTSDEIKSALENKFIPVSLGNTRLRTETAALVAATLLCIG